MLRLCSLFVFIALFASGVEAQSVDINWGEIVKKPDENVKKMLMVAAEEEYCYVVGGKREAQLIYKYDMDQKLVSSEKLNLRIDDKKLYLKGVLETLGGVVGIFTEVNVPEKKLEFYVADFEEGVFRNSRKVYEHFYKRKALRFKGAHSIYTRCKASFYEERLGMRLSADSSKIVFSNFLSQKGETGNNKIVVAVFDHTFNLLWDKVDDFYYKEKNVSTEKIVVSNDGKEVFILGRYQKPMQIEKVKKEDYKVYHISESEFKKYDFNLGEKGLAPKTLAPFYDEGKRTLFLAGLYENRKMTVLKKDHNVEGYISATLSLGENEIGDIHLIPFSEEEKKKFRSSGLGPKFYSSTFAITEFKALDNNIFYFLVNRQYFKPSGGGGTKNNNSGSGVSSYLYREFIAIFMNKEGTIINSSIISRRNASDFYRKGYAHFYLKGKIYLLLDSYITKVEKENFNFNYPNSHKLTKLVILKTDGSFVSENLLFTSQQVKRSIYDLLAIVHKNQLIFGGRVDKKNKGPGAIYGAKRIQFSSINLEKIK